MNSQEFVRNANRQGILSKKTENQIKGYQIAMCNPKYLMGSDSNKTLSSKEL